MAPFPTPSQGIDPARREDPWERLLIDSDRQPARPLGADRRAPDISADSVTALSRRVARTCIQIRSFDTPSPVLYIATFEILRDPIHHAMRGLGP